MSECGQWDADGPINSMMEERCRLGHSLRLEARNGTLLKQSDHLRRWNARRASIHPRDDTAAPRLEWRRPDGSSSRSIIIDGNCSVRTEGNTDLILERGRQQWRFRAAGGQPTLREWHEGVLMVQREEHRRAALGTLVWARPAPAPLRPLTPPPAHDALDDDGAYISLSVLMRSRRVRFCSSERARSSDARCEAVIASIARGQSTSIQGRLSAGACQRGPLNLPSGSMRRLRSAAKRICHAAKQQLRLLGPGMSEQLQPLAGPPLIQQLPQDIVLLICNHLSTVQDLLNVRLTAHILREGTPPTRMKRAFLANTFENLKCVQYQRNAHDRPFCVNSECVTQSVGKTRSAGNIYMFQLRKQNGNHLDERNMKESDRTSPFEWLYHDSRSPGEHLRRQEALLTSVMSRARNGEGSFDLVYFPYCPRCAARFVVEKCPPYYR